MLLRIRPLPIRFQLPLSMFLTITFVLILKTLRRSNHSFLERRPVLRFIDEFCNRVGSLRFVSLMPLGLSFKIIFKRLKEVLFEISYRHLFLALFCSGQAHHFFQSFLFLRS